MAAFLDVVPVLLDNFPTAGQQAFCLLIQLSRQIRRCVGRHRTVLHVTGIPSEQWLANWAPSLASLTYRRDRLLYVPSSPSYPWHELVIPKRPDPPSLRAVVAAMTESTAGEQLLQLRSFAYHHLARSKDVAAAADLLGDILEPGLLTALKFSNCSSQSGSVFHKLPWLKSLRYGRNVHASMLGGLTSLTSLSLAGGWDAGVVLPQSLQHLTLVELATEHEVHSMQHLSGLVDLEVVCSLPKAALGLVHELTCLSSLTRLDLDISGGAGKFSWSELTTMCSKITCLQGLHVFDDSQVPAGYGCTMALCSPPA